jgi:hypothetical protein
VRALAAIGKRLIKRKISTGDLFPGYEYGRINWLSEAALREIDKHQKALDFRR